MLDVNCYILDSLMLRFWTSLLIMMMTVVDGGGGDDHLFIVTLIAGVAFGRWLVRNKIERN